VAKSDWEHWEDAVVAGFPDWTRPQAGPDRGVDIISKDRRYVIETKYSIHGARDLHASLAQLAVYAGAHPNLDRAFFIVRLPRMSTARVKQEWHRLSSVLRPEVGQRLGIVAVAPDGVIVIPDDPETQRIAEHVRKIAADFRDDERTEGGPLWSRKSYEIWKVLLGAWLGRESALPLHEIQRRSGASYPTVSSVLDRLETLGELARGSNRSASLTGVPRRSLGEVLALGDGLRETHRFVDRSGRAPNATDLIRRIKAKAPDSALGGVEAARHYMPTFNLNGYPRVDESGLRVAEARGSGAGRGDIPGRERGPPRGASTATSRARFHPYTAGRVR